MQAFETEEAYTEGYISKYTTGYTFTGNEHDGAVIQVTETSTNLSIMFRKTRSKLYSGWMCVRINQC